MRSIKTPEKIFWVVMSIGLLTAEFMAIRHDYKSVYHVSQGREKP